MFIFELIDLAPPSSLDQRKILKHRGDQTFVEELRQVPCPVSCLLLHILENTVLAPGTFPLCILMGPSLFPSACSLSPYLTLRKERPVRALRGSCQSPNHSLLKPVFRGPQSPCQLALSFEIKSQAFPPYMELMGLLQSW